MCHAEPAATLVQAGHAAVDTTPPLGVELAGFHRPPGQERLATGIRQPTAARALMLKHGETAVVLVSLDIIGVSAEFARQTQQRIAQAVGVPADHVRICTTHTHSMPCFRYLRQWGAIPTQYMADVQTKIVEAATRAKVDLAPAQLRLGRQHVEGGNFNRTTGTWKTDAEFGRDATDATRWLDTQISALVFNRGADKQNMVWYHFSAHPVCYTDGNAGPDWVGLVDEKVRARNKLASSFLQGHAGDVNPGPGKPWLGIPEQVADAVYAGLDAAIQGAAPVSVDMLRSTAGQVDLPLDIPLFKQRLQQYLDDPSKCTGGSYVDARFAADWAEGAAKWDAARTTLAAPASALRLGNVALLFHPAELYSYYGLAIQRDSPCPTTLVVGYTDDIIGYLPDPNAYQAGEYAALTVPGILDLPPFTPQAAQRLAEQALQLLAKIA